MIVWFPRHVQNLRNSPWRNRKVVLFQGVAREVSWCLLPSHWRCEPRLFSSSWLAETALSQKLSRCRTEVASTIRSGGRHCKRFPSSEYVWFLPLGYRRSDFQQFSTLVWKVRAWDGHKTAGGGPSSWTAKRVVTEWWTGYSFIIEKDWKRSVKDTTCRSLTSYRSVTFFWSTCPQSVLLVGVSCMVSILIRTYNQLYRVLGRAL